MGRGDGAEVDSGLGSGVGSAVGLGGGTYVGSCVGCGVGCSVGSGLGFGVGSGMDPCDDGGVGTALALSRRQLARGRRGDTTFGFMAGSAESSGVGPAYGNTLGLGDGT